MDAAVGEDDEDDDQEGTDGAEDDLEGGEGEAIESTTSTQVQVNQGPWRMLGLISPWSTHPLTRSVVSGW